MEEGACEFVKTDEPRVGGRTRRTIMGCCQGKPGGLSKAERDSRWRNTGIVGLRDSNLKELPAEVVKLAVSIRTLDATHNRLVELPPEIENFINLQRLVRNSLHFQRLQRHEDLVSDSGCLS